MIKDLKIIFLNDRFGSPIAVFIDRLAMIQSNGDHAILHFVDGEKTEVDQDYDGVWDEIKAIEDEDDNPPRGEKK